MLLVTAPAVAVSAGGRQTITGSAVGPRVVQGLGNAHRTTSSRPPRGPRRAPHSYGTTLTNKRPNSGSGSSVLRGFRDLPRSGRRTTVGPSAPSANLVIHRPCGRRPGCCGEPGETCARRGGQPCEQARHLSAKAAPTWSFIVHRLCRRKTFPVGSRSLQPEYDRPPPRERCNGQNYIASITCGRLD